MGKLMAAVGDPSGASKGNIQEESSIQAMTRMGIPCFPAGTNTLAPRLNAVEQLLLQQRDGGPALIIDGTRCPELVRAMMGSYKYAKTKEGNSKPLPDKSHPYSDLADDLQYVCLAINSGLVNYVVRRIQPKQRKERPPAMSAAGWT